MYLSCVAQRTSERLSEWAAQTGRRTILDLLLLLLLLLLMQSGSLCESLSITHESIPYFEWEELKHSLHLRHCDVSEAFMQMFKRETSYWTAVYDFSIAHGYFMRRSQLGTDAKR